MQNDTSNTNLKITKTNDADAGGNPSRAMIAPTLGPVTGGHGTLSGQIQSGQRNQQILMPGQSSHIANSINKFFGQLNNRTTRPDTAIFNHTNYKIGDVAQNH